jgi:hypothetical protein
MFKFQDGISTKLEQVEFEQVQTFAWTVVEVLKEHMENKKIKENKKKWKFLPFFRKKNFEIFFSTVTRQWGSQRDTSRGIQGEESPDTPAEVLEYDNLLSRIEASETRISKELLDKAEQQVREDSITDDT